ncbi:DUF6093 family protein [Oerskovia turbata]
MAALPLRVGRRGHRVVLVSIDGVLRRARRAFHHRMRGSCVVTRPGDPVTGPDGRVTTPAVRIYPDPAWPQDHPDASGPVYIRYPGLAFENDLDSQGVTITQSRVVARLPFGVVFRPGDLITITADPDNPQLVGTVLRVASVDDQSQATAQRLLCEDNQAGVK